MKNISKVKRILEQQYARKFCKVNDVSQCPKGDACTCRIAAEVRAYMLSVIPEPYSKFNIQDFTGKDEEGNQVLNPDVAVNAKKQLLKYCWSGVSLENLDSTSVTELDDRSIIDNRRAAGDNVIVHGGVSDFGEEGKPRGRTFVASLIMKEAIKRRLVPKNASQTYDWISYSLLLKHLKDDDGMMLSEIKSCDWLVVDDIPTPIGRSRSSDGYISSLLEAFFCERVQDGLPTIFVFRFNVSEIADTIEQSFGVTLSKIVHDSKTCNISLS